MVLKNKLYTCLRRIGESGEWTDVGPDRVLVFVLADSLFEWILLIKSLVQGMDRKKARLELTEGFSENPSGFDMNMLIEKLSIALSGCIFSWCFRGWEDSVEACYLGDGAIYVIFAPGGSLDMWEPKSLGQ